MLDCKGQPVRAGDLIAYANKNGHHIGTVQHEPDDVRWVKLHVKLEDGEIRYFQKRSMHILNLTAYLPGPVDRTIVGVLH